jgi:hypothetical protein
MQLTIVRVEHIKIDHVDSAARPLNDGYAREVSKRYTGLCNQRHDAISGDKIHCGGPSVTLLGIVDVASTGAGQAIVGVYLRVNPMGTAGSYNWSRE